MVRHDPRYPGIQYIFCTALRNDLVLDGPTNGRYNMYIALTS